MKKALRFLVVIGLILSMMTPLLSCSSDDVQDLIDKNTGKLNTPTGIYLDSDNVLRWNSVDNASHYIVNIDEKEYTRSTVACDLKKILTVNGDYEVYVKATSDRTGIADSDYSEPVIIHYTGASDDTSDKETKLFGQFDDLFTAEAYIGYGYDVIGASYLNSREVKVNYPIFDHDKLMQQRLVKFNERDSQDEYISSNSVSSYQERVEAKLNTKLKVKKAFSGSFGVKYQSTSETTASALFYEYRHSTVCYSLVLQCDFNDYRDMLTESFKRDLMTLDIGTLFERYGTHVITSAIMGGRFDLNYTMLSDKAIDTSKLSASIDTTLKAWVVDTSMDASVSIENQAKESNCTISSYSKVIGGDYIQLNNEKAILANYQKWLNTIEQKPALIGIRDINSLVPIWELLGDSEAEQERKAELQRVFEKYGQDSYDALLENYDVKPLTYPNSLTVTVKDSEHMPITGDIVYSGTTVYLDLQVEPEIAHIEKSIKVDKSDYVVLNTTNNSLFIKKDTPANTTLNITVDVGHGVSQVISLRVVPTYTVDFRCNGGLTTDGSVLSPQLNIPHGNTIDPPETITKSGYRFVGWFADQSYSTPFLFGETPITDNLTLYAKWEPITYKANFYIEKGNLYQTQTVAYNAAPTLPEEPTKVGHTFKGWFSDAECTQVFDFSAILTADCNIYAKWEINIYTVTFEPNGGSEVAQQTVAYGEKVKRPATVKEGSTLAGWYTDAACATLFDFSQDVVTGNMTLYAKWTANPVTVSFDCMGGEPVDNRITEHGSALGDAMPVPVRLGYTFAGWYTEQTGGTRFYATDAVNGSITLYARWTANTYTVTFDGNGGTPSTATLTCTYGNTYGDLPDVSRTGYTFAGWYLGSTKITSGTILTTANDHVLEALWISNSYTVSFDVSSSTIKTVPSLDMNSLDIRYDSIIKLPVPTANYYDFIGWYLDEEGHVQFSDSEGNMLNAWDRDENQTLYAQWKKAEEYKDYEYINSKEELINISPTGNTLLVADIDMENYEWNMIDTFSGRLDGAGNMISNLVIKSTSVQYLGLFAQNSGCIENIVFSGIQVSYSVSDSYYSAYVGIIAGFNTGTINECAIRSSTITCWLYKNIGTSSVIKVSVGGIAGRNEKVIYGCSVQDTRMLGESSIGVSDGKVEANSGGIVGMNLGNGTIENCTSESNKIESVVHGGKTWTATRYKTYARAGGIVGYNEASVIACNVSDNALRADYSTVQGSYPDNYNSTGDIAGKNNGTIS